MLCPHAAIRCNVVEAAKWEMEHGKGKMEKHTPPCSMHFVPHRTKELGPDLMWTLNISPADCTGCKICVENCPTRALSMTPIDEADQSVFDSALTLPEFPREKLNLALPKHVELLPHYFEFPGACAGCGEAGYIRLATQLFGERMIIANATGCSSIYGGSSPTCPYTVDEKGRGPAWANSLFEDNAEFGYGIKLANEIRGKSDSVWIFGGDGWADDIGYGGLDHIVAQNLDVNILVLDTQVYSNTGGQSSKSTPAGAIAKFASGGKATQSKDLGAMIMNYENVYVAQIALGANYAQALTAIKEAEAHKGPSVIIAYSTCINHGIDMSNGMKTMKNAVESGYWMLYRRTPATKTKAAELIIDSKEPTGSYQDFIKGETRFKALERVNPETAKVLFESGEQNSKRRYEKYKKLTGK
jgi:pyruvate-ferredoxin/flavodoxin oxidoreductase